MNYNSKSPFYEGNQSPFCEGIEVEAGAMVAENLHRLEARKFDPVSGFGSPGKRIAVPMDCPVLGKRVFYLPETMMRTETGRAVIEGRDFGLFARERGLSPEHVAELFERVRLRHDFPYWAAKYGIIRPKRGGANSPLVLNAAQRKLISKLEELRVSGKPIRIILLKARQWGGSTAIQLYMVWLQLVVGVGLNSLIVAHQNVATEEIRAMMKRVVDSYPTELLCADFEAAEKGLLENRFELPKKKSRRKRDEDTEEDGDVEKKSSLKAVGRSGNTWHLPARNCDFRIGTAERPDSTRGGSYSLVHLSEVGIWRETEGKKPGEIVISATSGVLAEPGTLIVLESTAKGIGSYFHREYVASKKGKAQWEPVFVAWYDIEQYSLRLEDPVKFARWLIENRNNTTKDERSESGSYLWNLWESGATLEAINWYIWERRKYESSDAMASEYPSDDVEAFASSGSPVFCAETVGRLIEGTREPTIHASRNANLRVWKDFNPEREYLAVMKVGQAEKEGRSVAAVVDITRPMRPEVAAELLIGGQPEDAIREVRSLGERYGWCRLALVAESGNVVEVGHTDYVADILREEYPVLHVASRTRLIYELDARRKVMMTDTLSSLVVSGLWKEPSREAAEQFRTFESDPAEGYRPVPGSRDDLLLVRILAVHIARYEF